MPLRRWLASILRFMAYARRMAAPLLIAAMPRHIVGAEDSAICLFCAAMMGDAPCLARYVAPDDIAQRHAAMLLLRA